MVPGAPLWPQGQQRAESLVTAHPLATLKLLRRGGVRTLCCVFVPGPHVEDTPVRKWRHKQHVSNDTHLLPTTPSLSRTPPRAQRRGRTLLRFLLSVVLSKDSEPHAHKGAA